MRRAHGGRFRGHARIAIALILLAAPTPVGAQRCPGPEDASEALAEVPASRRADFLLARARSAAEEARTWTAIFAVSYFSIAATQTAVVSVIPDGGERSGLAVGAISAMIGVASLHVLPLSILVDIEDVESLAGRARAGDCEALARMEHLLDAGAGSESFGTSWLVHVGNVLFNVGVGLVLGLGYDQWISAGISTGIGIAVGEVQILTQPMPLVRSMAAYRSGRLEEPMARSVARGGLSAAFAF